MIKVTYIEQRREGDSREYWTRRWRRHGGFAMQFAEFWDPIHLYIQNDCIADMSGFEGVDASFGGIGELFYTDMDACQSSLATPNMPTIVADGDQVFGRRRAVHLVTRTRNLMGDRPGTVRIFAYASRPGNMARQEFADRLDTAFEASLAELSPAPVSAATSHHIEDRGEHESVLDFSYNGIEDARAGHAAWLASVGKDEFLDEALHGVPLKVVTHSCIYYDMDRIGEGE